jgi:hypothetical protein
MAKPLRSQLNQVRAWVRQGRTDAWIAHQLEVSTSELREFRRRHELDATEEPGEVDLRDEIEAEIEAAAREEELAAEVAAAEEAEVAEAEADVAEAEVAEAEVVEAEEAEAEEAEEPEDGGRDEGEPADSDGERPRRRRRRRRGGRGGRSKRPGAAMQASFDHGDEGYGLWLDPAIADDPVYAEHWANHRRIEVTVEPDRIVIRRSDGQDEG